MRTVRKNRKHLWRPNESITIRIATARHADAIFEIIAHHLSPESLYYFFEGGVTADIEADKKRKELLKSRDLRCRERKGQIWVVAEMENRIVGFGWVSRGSNNLTGEYALIVADEEDWHCHNRGVGKALFQALRFIAYRWDYEHITGLILAANRWMVRIAMKCGCKQTECCGPASWYGQDLVAAE